MKLGNVEHTFVGGIKTANLSRRELINLCEDYVDGYRLSDITQNASPLIVFDTNGHGLSMAHSNPSFYELLKQADIVHADGQSIVFFSSLFNQSKISERTATTDTIHDFPNYGYGPIKHFLLGGKKSTVESCADILTKQYKNFQIAGTQHGYFSDAETDDIISSINQSGADVLWVGLGKPKEQQFVIDNKSKIKVPVIITCGGCYNYITGDYSRAPLWLQKLGLEWLARVLTEPKKFFWRYLTTNPHAIYCVLKHRNVRY